MQAELLRSWYDDLERAVLPHGHFLHYAIISNDLDNSSDSSIYKRQNLSDSYIIEKELVK